MAVKRDTVTFTSLNKEIKSGSFKNIYVLQGEEPYFIDRLQELIIDTALTEDQRDFNLSLYYGNTANVREVISACQQYPAFSQYKVVVVREAQLISKQPGHKNDLDLFASYAEKPLPSTILVICHKGDALKSKSFTDALKAAKSGVVFTSKKVREGRDLEKLAMLTDDNNISPLLIEQNIGISKDYNNFELEEALARRDAAKAFRIVDYFERNPKNNPSVVSIAMLFSFFSNALLTATASDKSLEGIMDVVGTRSQWRARKFLDTTRVYSTRSLVNIIGYLRECDTRSKGIGSRQDQYALLKDLVYKILHA